MTSHPDLEKIGDTAYKAAEEAANVLTSYFQGKFTVSSKGSNHNLVTEVDVKAETTILSTIRKVFPQHNVLAEEAGAQFISQSEPTWVIDPLDGTLNFVRGVPIFAVSIGVFYNEEMIAGVVLQPITNELFFAKKGHGAFLNGSKISVSSVNSIQNAVCVSGIPYYDQDKPNRSIDQFGRMLTLGCPIRDLGSAAIDLSYLAAGRFDGFWMPTVLPWDLAAAACIVQEAGGRFTLYNGQPYKELNAAPIVATNGLIHEQIRQKLTSL